MFAKLKDGFPQMYQCATEHPDLFTRIAAPARTALLKEGEVARKMVFIEKGCIRMWFNNHGRDVTMQFFFEGQAVSSSESFYTGQPSLFTMEAIEPCVVHTISKDKYMELINGSPALKAEMEALTYKRWFHYQRLFLSRIKDNPQQRYVQLQAESPEVIARVPQHYIASYLGITPVSLSRIKNKML